MKGTKKYLPFLLTVLIALCIAAAASASTEYISGNTSAATAFYVETGTGNAYIDLYSYKGNAQVDKYSMPNAYISTAAESHYGFYAVTVAGENYSQTYYWTPSGQVNTGSEYVVSTTMRIPLPNVGKYMVTVEPFTAEQISQCWYYDRFRSWTDQACWLLAGEYGCTGTYFREFDSLNAKVNCYDLYGNFLMSYTESITADTTLYPRQISGYYSSDYVTLKFFPDAPTQDLYNVVFTYFRSEAQVEVYCYDQNNNIIGSYTETIYDSQYIQPPAYNGYRLLSGAEYVTLNRANNTASPSRVSFRYEYIVVPTATPVPAPTAAPAPTAVPGGSSRIVPAGPVVAPSSWTTQFQDRAGDLWKLADDNNGTFFWWLIHNADLLDQYPELTAYFDNATVSTISIRNGRPGQYSKYARVASFRAEIYHDGGMSTAYVHFPDTDTTQYQTVSLGGTYTGVTRIDLFLDGGEGGTRFYPGVDKGKYYIYVRDVQFGQ